MELSVAHTFEPGIIGRLSAFPEVAEIYGKLNLDVVGGGRSSYTLRANNRADVTAEVSEAHAHGIRYNYLLNGATLSGLEQTRGGQKEIRRLLDYLTEIGVDAVTVAAPYLLRLIKKQYPHFRVRASVFAVIDRPSKARQWEEMGVDTICLPAISLNRDFRMLEKLRRSVACGLQLILNASCLPGCAWELSHMNLLTTSSRKGSQTGTFCFDYCFLQCSAKRVSDPVNYIKAIWIRPEDVHLYEELGIDSFKIVERSCPGDLLVSRVKAYVERRFEGNLLELVAPVAQIKKEQGTGVRQRARIIASMARPDKVSLASLRGVKRYAELAILHDYSAEGAPIYLDNRVLDGFLDGIKSRDCEALSCESCGYCRLWAKKSIRIDETYQRELSELARELDDGLVSSTHWLKTRPPRSP